MPTLMEQARDLACLALVGSRGEAARSDKTCIVCGIMTRLRCTPDPTIPPTGVLRGVSWLADWRAGNPHSVLCAACAYRYLMFRKRDMTPLTEQHRVVSWLVKELQLRHELRGESLRLSGLNDFSRGPEEPELADPLDDGWLTNTTAVKRYACAAGDTELHDAIRTYFELPNLEWRVDGMRITVKRWPLDRIIVMSSYLYQPPGNSPAQTVFLRRQEVATGMLCDNTKRAVFEFVRGYLTSYNKTLVETADCARRAGFPKPAERIDERVTEGITTHIQNLLMKPII